MARPRVFLDSSVLIAALLSSRGGSFYILTSLREKFSFVINEYIFDEVIAALDEKFAGREDLKNKFFSILGLAQIKIVPDEPKDKIKFQPKLLNKKDMPILASAIKNSSYLLTLDNDFLSEEVLGFAKSKNLVISKPREFIRYFT